MTIASIAVRLNPHSAYMGRHTARELASHSCPERHAARNNMPTLSGVGRVSIKGARVDISNQKIKGARLDIFLNIVPGPFECSPTLISAIFGG